VALEEFAFQARSFSVHICPANFLLAARAQGAGSAGWDAEGCGRWRPDALEHRDEPQSPGSPPKRRRQFESVL